MTIREKLDAELLDYIDRVLTVCSARAAYVLNHMLEDGFITSEHIRQKGFVHGARAIGDVRDNGIPLITERTKSSDGRNIARYKFGSPNDIKRHKFGGRINFPARLKKQLLNLHGPICNISKQSLPESELQIDHRIPFYISGDIEGERDPSDFMLLSKSLQRAKSWDCEHCPNILEHFDLNICRTCYWAYPENYTHLATKELRQVNVTWEGKEVSEYDALEFRCEEEGKSVQDYIKDLVRRATIS